MSELRAKVEILLQVSHDNKILKASQSFRNRCENTSTVMKPDPLFNTLVSWYKTSGDTLDVLLDNLLYLWITSAFLRALLPSALAGAYPVNDLAPKSTKIKIEE